MSAVKPIHYTARKNGKIYRAIAESYIGSCLNFGSVESDIPEQPRNMRELTELRLKGYIVETERNITNV